MGLLQANTQSSRRCEANLPRFQCIVMDALKDLLMQKVMKRVVLGGSYRMQSDLLQKHSKSLFYCIGHWQIPGDTQISMPLLAAHIAAKFTATATAVFIALPVDTARDAVIH